MLGQQVSLFIKYDVYVAPIALDLPGAVCKIGHEVAGAAGAQPVSGSSGFGLCWFQP